jgi:hypothetical protein
VIRTYAQGREIGNNKRTQNKKYGTRERGGNEIQYIKSPVPDLYHGSPISLWQRALSVTEGWFAGRMWKNNKWFGGKNVNQSLYRPIAAPQGSRRSKLPDFETIGTLRR